MNQYYSFSYFKTSLFKIIPLLFVLFFIQMPLQAQDFNPLDFGAFGDGITDDTGKVQDAINAAIRDGGGVTFPEGKVFAVKKLVVRNGIKYMQGGEVKFIEHGSGISMVGKQNLNPQNVKNLKYENIVFDHNHVKSRAIFGQNVSEIVVNNCIFKNRTDTTTSIAFLADTNGGEDMLNNRITNNEFYGKRGVGQNITIGSRILNEGYARSGPGSYWEVHKSTAPAKFRAKNTLISGNIIEGGYYGVGTVKAVNTTIENNTITNNIRSLSLQHDTNNSIVRNNNLSNPNSSSITLARGSSGNLIENNTINTNDSEGEAMLQAYLGCNNNTFRNNTVTTAPNSRNGRSPRWMIYVAVHCNNNVFDNNTFTGTADFAYIGVETGWDSTIADTSHRAIYAGTETDNYASEGMSGLQITNNMITPGNEERRILITEVKDPAGSFYLSNAIIENNTIVNESDYCIEIIYDGISSFDADLNGIVDECTIGQPAVSNGNCNLVTNGNFDNGSAGWLTYNHAEATSNFNVSNGNCHIEINNPSNTNWHIQLIHRDIPLEQKTYTVSFRARANSARPIVFNWAENGGEYKIYHQETANLTTNWQTFSYTINSTIRDLDARIVFFLGLQSAGVYLDDVVIEEADCGADNCELVSNGDFAGNHSDWLTYDHGSASSTWNFSNNIAHANINNSGDALWYVQLIHTNIALEQNKTYNISIRAKASAARKMDFILHKQSGDFKTYYSERLDLTTDWQTYNFNFTSGVTDLDARIVFFLGQESADVYFDNMSIHELNCTENREAQNLNTNLTVFPNPTSGDISVKYAIDDPTEKGQIKIFDVWGRQVHEATFEAASQGVEVLYLSGLLSGHYFLQFQVGEHISRDKIVVF